MALPTRVSSFSSGVLTAAAVVVILLGMKTASSMLGPMLLAVLLAIIVSPLYNRLLKRGLPGWAALAGTLAAFVAVIVVFIILAALSLRGFNAALPHYQERAVEIRDSLDQTLQGFGLELEEMIGLASGSPGNLFNLVASFSANLLGGLANWGVVLLAGVFFLTEASVLPRLLKNLAVEELPLVVRITRFGHDVRRFMVITSWIGLLTAIVNVVLLLILGVDFALLWGVLSFLLNFVPNIGFLLSVIPPALLALIGLGVPQAAIVVVGFVLINGAAENIMKPRLIEEDFDLSPSVTFVSLIVWTWVLGALGAILAIPMTMLVQVILESNESTRWISYMFSTGKEPFDPEVETPAEIIAESAPGAPILPTLES